jgi:predicted AlkP superfamily phosphohydrolase/phosphomutase
MAGTLLAMVATCARHAENRICVTIVGIDGAAWRVIDPMLARGELPNVAQLIERGVRAPLRSEPPLLSPAVWTTIATGVSRQRHGVTGFRNAKGGLVSSADRKTAALWTVVSVARRRSAVINWWATYPAEAIDGVVVTERALKTHEDDIGRIFLGMWQRTVPKPVGVRLVEPPAAAELLADLLAAEPGTRAGESDFVSIPPRMRREDAAVVASLVRLREHLGPFDLEMILLRGIDPVSHQFWKFYEPDAAAYRPAERPQPDDVAKYGRTVEDHYAYVDSLLAAVVAANGPEDRVVFLVSDHGFEAGTGPLRSDISGTHESAAAIDGILVAAGGPLKRGARLRGASILDVAPTVAHVLGLPVAADLEGRVLTEAFDPTWIAAHPVARVPTYARPAAGRDTEPIPSIDRAILEDLEALGYR